jgi:hypothetical protein
VHSHGVQVNRFADGSHPRRGRRIESGDHPEDAVKTTEGRETAEILNSLLRGEISAAETYGQAITKFERHPEAERLRRLREDHVNAANLLRRHVVVRGEENVTDSGAWGAFAKTVEGTAKLFGNAAAVKALKEGEEHGVKEYESALERKDLDPAARELIAKTILPRQRAHVPEVDSLLKQA